MNIKCRHLPDVYEAMVMAHATLPCRLGIPYHNGNMMCPEHTQQQAEACSLKSTRLNM